MVIFIKVGRWIFGRVMFVFFCNQNSDVPLHWSSGWSIRVRAKVNYRRSRWTVYGRCGSLRFGNRERLRRLRSKIEAINFALFDPFKIYGRGRQNVWVSFTSSGWGYTSESGIGLLLYCRSICHSYHWTVYHELPMQPEEPLWWRFSSSIFPLMWLLTPVWPCGCNHDFSLTLCGYTEHCVTSN